MALALANYHPKLREGVLGDVPDTAGDKAFLADGELSETEIAALDRAQSVFGMQTFYQAWELDALTPNEVHAVLYMLTFYDPYTTVHDVTANLDDPDAEGAEITRTLDDFGVYAGMCLYCRQKVGQPVAGFDVPHDAAIKLIRRVVLQHLAHHAKVQADALSPCDLRDFTELELVALGATINPTRTYIYDSSKYPYSILLDNFTASVRLTDELLQFEKGFPRGRAPGRVRTAKVLVGEGEVLSPFTHAMRSIGGPPSERGLEPCLEAVKRIVDWDTKRYDHFSYAGEALFPYFDVIFPRARSLNTLYAYPTWTWFLVDESGGQDKAMRLMNQFRALNLPAVMEQRQVVFDKTAAEASSVLRGANGVLLSPWDLYIHRNIGFSVSDYQAGLDDRIRLHPLPEHCGLERIRPGTFETIQIPANTYGSGPARTEYFWKRDRELPPDLYWNSNYGMSFWIQEDSRFVLWRLILEYACE